MKASVKTARAQIMAAMSPRELAVAMPKPGRHTLYLAKDKNQRDFMDRPNGTRRNKSRAMLPHQALTPSAGPFHRLVILRYPRGAAQVQWFLDQVMPRMAEKWELVA